MHNGEAETILTKRHELYEAAKALHPERWNNRNTRNWSLPENASLNPDKVEEPEYYGSNVPLFRRNGYRQSGTMIP